MTFPELMEGKPESITDNGAIADALVLKRHYEHQVLADGVTFTSPFGLTFRAEPDGDDVRVFRRFPGRDWTLLSGSRGDFVRLALLMMQGVVIPVEGVYMHYIEQGYRHKAARFDPTLTVEGWETVH